ncbi:MAG: D-alanine--D-alanine ligase [Phycisphaerae bacterium]|nr:D-alanine--D-alanine ligase [Phycisphaerae bacterium]MDD5380588.1 D-alanine--D-alanine ligase [Phycisphaerae bacterium]
MTAEPSAGPQSPLKVKAAVLMGGIGEERDISIQSGGCVAQALKQARLNVVTYDVRPDNLEILEDGSIDVFFLALHGRFGEDGQLQQILEDKGLCYTGSGPQACRLALDKMASKKAFAKAGVPTPAVVEFKPDADPSKLEKHIKQVADKFVVKPVSQGSSVGVTIVDNPKSALAEAQKCSASFGDCMIEEYIAGREITVGVLLDRALPIIEIKSKTDFYDYHAKYVDDRTQFLFDTIGDPSLTKKIEAAAIDCFNALGLRHFARLDFILSDDENFYALEANSIPGLTSHSLLPKAAARIGLSMSDLCTKIIDAALENKKAACRSRKSK